MKIMVRTDLPDNQKLFTLASMLEIDEVLALGLVARIWIRAMSTKCEDGVLLWTPQTVARAAGWTGDANVFVKALVECGEPKEHGFLELVAGGYAIHDWLEEQGALIRARVRERSRRRAESQDDAAPPAPTVPSEPPDPHTETIGRLIMLMDKKCIPGHPAAKRDQIRSWAKRTSWQKVEQVLMSKEVEGRTLFEIQRDHFDAPAPSKKEKGIEQILKERQQEAKA